MSGVSQVRPAIVRRTLADVIANVAELNMNVSATYVEAEVQSIADKVDAVIAALVAAGLMAAS